MHMKYIVDVARHAGLAIILFKPEQYALVYDLLGTLGVDFHIRSGAAWVYLRNEAHYNCFKRMFQARFDKFI